MKIKIQACLRKFPHDNKTNFNEKAIIYNIFTR